MAKQLSQKAAKYLKELFGYDDVAKIDQLTLEDIQENANDGYPLDREIIQVRKYLEINDGKTGVRNPAHTT